MFNQVFRLTEENWMIEFNLIRVPATDYPPKQTFPDVVSGLIDEERRGQYQAENQQFDTVTYLTISRGPTVDLSKTVKKFALETDEEIKADTLDEYLEKFEIALSSIIDTFSGVFDIRRLAGEEILKFLHYCISGVNEYIGMPGIPIYMDAYLANNDFIGALEPIIGEKHIKILDFQDFPTHSYPTIIQPFLIYLILSHWNTAGQHDLSR
jgi:type IV secretory pathway VirB4 component